MGMASREYKRIDSTIARKSLILVLSFAGELNIGRKLLAAAQANFLRSANKESGCRTQTPKYLKSWQTAICCSDYSKYTGPYLILVLWLANEEQAKGDKGRPVLYDLLRQNRQTKQ